MIARAPHKWNESFSWHDHDDAVTTISPEQAKQFDELGYFVVEDAFDAATLARLDQELLPGDDAVKRFLADVPDGRFSVAGLDTQIVAPHAVTRSDFAREFVAGELLAGI